MAPGPSAADATVADALELLDGPFASLADHVSQDRYALWLGSGISLGRVEDLHKLIFRVLHFLQRGVSAGDPNCPFRVALTACLSLARSPPPIEVTSMLKSRSPSGRTFNPS
jgi:hypothetical protein